MKQKMVKHTKSVLMAIPMIVALSALFIFSVAYAQQGLVPCGNPGQDDCTLCHSLVLIQNIINFIVGPGGTSGTPVGIIYPLAILMIGIGGILWFMSGGSQTRISYAKGIIFSAIWGLVIGLASFLIINTVLNVISGQGLSNAAAKPTGFPWAWNNIQCTVVPGGTFQINPITGAGGTSTTQAIPGVLGCTATAPAGSPACPGTVQINIPDNGNANPYAVPAMARALETVHNQFRNLVLTEGCPPTNPHLSSSHCNGNAVDIKVTNPSDQSIGQACEALRAQGVTVIQNEYGASCDDAYCAASNRCGPPRTFTTTTGQHIHLDGASGQPGQQLACTINSVVVNPSGDQGGNWYNGSSIPFVNIQIYGSVACSGTTLSVTMYEEDFGIDDAILALSGRQITWPAGARGVHIDLGAGEEQCDVSSAPDCIYYVDVVPQGGSTIRTFGQSQGELRYDCDGLCIDPWHFGGVQPIN